MAGQKAGARIAIAALLQTDLTGLRIEQDAIALGLDRFGQRG
jgi:hypothetical protein